jgi:hypothetical protein
MKHKNKVKRKKRSAEFFDVWPVKSFVVATLLTFAFSLSTATAQESVNATGGDASGSEGTVAYSLGQVFYTTSSGSSGTISQGVQQTYEISTVGMKETELTISLSVFPNPTTDQLTLQINDYNNEKLTYQLFDMQGKLLSSKVITSNQTQINMSDLPVATYFMIVMQENRKIKSFKIIKN